MKDYHLLLACDKHYLPYMFVACQSIINGIKNSARGINNDERIVFNMVIDSSVNKNYTYEGVVSFVKSFCNRNSFINTLFHFYNADEEEFEEARGWGDHQTKSTFYRLLIDRFLPKDINQILYIDIDVLILGDVRELLEKPMNNAVLGSVYNPISWRPDYKEGKLYLKPLTNKNKTTIINETEYFNAGVLLINMKQWRKQGIGHKAVEFINQYNPLVADQDALNAVTKDNINLDWSWNFQTWMFYVDKSSFRESGGNIRCTAADVQHFTCNYIDLDSLQKGLEGCKLIHYTYCKPWKEAPFISNSKSHLLFNEQVLKSLQMWQELARQTPECIGVHIPNTTNTSVLGDIANHTAIKLTKELEQIKYKRRKQNKIIISAIGVLFVLQIISIFF